MMKENVKKIIDLLTEEELSQNILDEMREFRMMMFKKRENEERYNDEREEK